MALSFDTEYDRGLETYAKAVDKGDAELMRLGFPDAERPIGKDGYLEDLPSLPNLQLVTDPSELIGLLSRFTAWYDYTMTILPRVTSEKNAAEAARDFAWAKIRKNKEGTVEDKNDETRTDARYIEAAAYFETCDFKQRKIKAIADRLLRDIETISRAMTGSDQQQRAYGLAGSAVSRANRYGHGPREHMSVRDQFRVTGKKKKP